MTFKIIGGTTVYGFALFGLLKSLQDRAAPGENGED